MTLSLILASIFICLVGAILYALLVRPFASLRVRKGIILGIFLLSVLLPLSITNAFEATSINESQVLDSQFVFSDDIVPTPELLACYERATTEEGYCDCEENIQRELLVFKNDNFLGALSFGRQFMWYALLGILLFLFVRTLLRLWHINKKLRGGSTSLLQWKNKTVRLVTSSDFKYAAAFGLFRNYILWNQDLNSLDKQERASILRHELTHIDNKDTLLRLVTNALAGIWFLNPAYWYLRRELFTITEHMADENALNELPKKEYAQLLMRLKFPNHLQLLPAFGSDFLKTRIKYFLPKKPISVWLRSTTLTTFLCLYGIFAFNMSNLCCNQLQELKLYQLLKAEHDLSGDVFFCKDCVLEK